MSKRYLIQNMLIIIFGIAIIMLSFSYSESLSVETSGPAKIEVSKENIIFSNIQEVNVDNSLVEVRGPSVLGKKTNLNFDLKFKDKVKYQFTIDVVNKGSQDQVLKTYSLSLKNTLDDKSIIIVNDENSISLTNVLKYNVTYSDGTPIKANDVIDKYSKKTLNVEVLYEKNNKANYEFNLNLYYE